MAVTITPPVDLRAALPDLRRPFTVDAVKWKVQSTAKDGSGAVVVAYIDARLVIDRLNAVCAGDWSDRYEPVQGGLLCELTVCGVTRRDVGVADPDAQGGIKALYSDAFKRAAVKFGIGASIYALPTVYLKGDSLKRRNDGKIVGIASAAVRNLSDRYGHWLQTTGVERFGEPLDHGDVGQELDESAPPAPATPAADTRVDPETGEILEKPLRGRVADMLNTLSNEEKVELSTAAAKAGLKPSLDGLVAEFGETAADIVHVRRALAERLHEIAKTDPSIGAAAFAAWLKTPESGYQEA